MSTIVKFEIYLYPIDNNISGYELGGLSIQLNEKLITSQFKVPDQSMMIFISLSDLLIGIRNLWLGKTRSFKFVGTDSSFSIIFSKLKNNMLQLIHQDITIVIEFDVFKEKCYWAIEHFYSTYKNKIDHNDPVLTDLHNNLSKYKKDLL